MQAASEKGKRPAGQSASAAQPAAVAWQPAPKLEFNEDGEPLNAALYLLANGWKKVPIHEAPSPKRRWLDPTSGTPDRRVKVQNELRDGTGLRVTKEAVYQVYAGRPAWYSTEAEAVQIQRDRDEEAKKKK